MEESEFRAMLDESQRHWWYRGRRRIVCDTLEALRLPPSTRILDAGCGSGAMLDQLARYGDTTGVEPHPLGVAAAHRAGHPRVVRARVEELPFAAASFELITCLDVIEHTPDDRLALQELHRVTVPGGYLVVTVPAYPALWSQHDVVNGHHRRYVKRTLMSAATEAGWRPVRHRHFNTFFLLPAAIVRSARRPATARPDPQDPPRGDRHAGEPLVRQLLRDLSGRAGYPDAARRADRLRAGPADRDLLAALPRSTRQARRRPARRDAGADRHRRRAHGRIHPRGGALAPPVSEPERPRVLAELGDRRDGVARRARDPQLLGLRAPLRAAGPDVRGEPVLEPAPAPVHGVRVVRPLLTQGRPDELRERAGRTAESAGLRRDQEAAPLRLDGPHVAAAPGRRELGLLRLQGR